MAATTTVKFLYPPEFQHGDYVDTGIGPSRYVAQLLGEATGTEDETAVVKIAIGDMVNQWGETATKFVIEKVEYELLGFTGVHLSFDRIPANRVFSMGGAGSGSQDFKRIGGLVDTGEGGTGNLLLTTVGGSQYDTYNIVLTFRVK